MEDHDHHKKKRVGKACDSCRIKKTKCDGKKPCSKCKMDNKICVFTERKKVKDKVHPSGYVELLETRLDLLTKSLEKILVMSKAHLPFIAELLKNDEDSAEETIPINKVVQYLIEKENLLQNLPGECNEALIAANLGNSDENTLVRSNSNDTEGETYDDNRKSSPTEAYAANASEIENFGTASKSSQYNTSLFSVKSEPNSAIINSPNANSLTESLDLNDYSLGGFSSNVLSDGTYNDVFSDFESDPARPGSLMGESLSDGFFYSGANYSKLKSMNTGDNIASYLTDVPSLNSISTLTNDFATNLTTQMSLTSHSNLSNEQRAPGLTRSSSSALSIQSHQKSKINGHVHKPRHHPHAFASSLSRSQHSLSSSASDLSLSKGLSSGSSSDSPLTIDSVSGSNDLRESLSLPSDAVKNCGKNLNILDTSGIDGLLITNPFLK